MSFVELWELITIGYLIKYVTAIALYIRLLLDGEMETGTAHRHEHCYNIVKIV